MLRKTTTILSLIGLLLSVASWATPWRIQYKFSGAIFHWSGGGFGVCTQWLSDGSFDSSRRGWTIRSNYELSWVPQLIPIKNWRDYKLSWARCFYLTISNWWLPSWISLVICSVTFCLCDPLRNTRRRKRKKLGLCVKCGYDLRASKDRCPERGVEFETT